MSSEQENLSGKMTVLSIVNGMIGGLILLLPVMALEAGWLLTLIALIVTGLLSYYSCNLCIIHTGNQPDLDIAIKKHFWNSKKVKIFYQVCIWLNLILIITLYFELIVYQWIGLAPPHKFTKVNSLINSLVLLALVFFIKYRDFGANLMAYGIISIISYLVFITWVAVSENTSNKQVQFEPFGGNSIQLIAALAQAYAIQCFFIPVIKKNKQINQHKKYLVYSFILGGIAYAYIAFMGSYGILYREYLDYNDNQKTIEGYFGMNTWQVNAIQVIYLIHLYSVFPEYLLIGKRRFFSVFNLQQSQNRKINKNQVIYILFVISYCLIMAVNRISLRQIIDINGAVLGFFFIYFFPVALHFKCKYLKQKTETVQLSKKQQNYAQMNEENQAQKQVMMDQKQKPLQLNQIQKKQNLTDNKQSALNSQDKKVIEVIQKNQSEPTNEYDREKQQNIDCKCSYQPVSKKQKIFEISIMSIMLLIGGFTLIDGILELFRD